MRCKNCGWDNPAGNAKCEKCNVPLAGSMVDERMPPLERTTSEDYNPVKTVQGCPQCGYALRPSVSVCPNCGLHLTDDRPVQNDLASQTDVFEKDRNLEQDDIKEKVPHPRHGGGTVIQGNIVLGTRTNESERKKLVGFLVTYSHLENGEFFPLYEGRSYIGRNPSSNVYIKNDSKVSERHLSILYRVVDRKFKFKDEQSTNGTFLNGDTVPIDEGELKNFDEIRVGNTLLIFIAIPQVSN